MENLKFAIQMELDGEKFYLEQAEINKDNNLATIFNFLAKDERKHAKLLQSKMDNKSYELVEDESLVEYKNVFEDSEDFSLEEKANPSQTDAYRLALKKEKESIELYKKLEEEATDKEGKELFAFLVKMEKNHYRIFEELVNHLRHGEEWVEDAEFGTRGTY